MALRFEAPSGVCGIRSAPLTLGLHCSSSKGAANGGTQIPLQHVIYAPALIIL
jgi:hypothetical protein